MSEKMYATTLCENYVRTLCCICVYFPAVSSERYIVTTSKIPLFT